VQILLAQSVQKSATKLTNTLRVSSTGVVLATLANNQGDHSFSTMIFHDFSMTTKNEFP